MGASIAISTAAFVQSSAAQAAAREAQIKACTAEVRGFQNDTATIAERQSYAGCIDLLHPQPLSDGGAVLLKVCIALMFAGMFAGIWWGRRNQELSRSMLGAVVTGSLMGAVATAGLLLALSLIAAGVRFLFS